MNSEPLNDLLVIDKDVLVQFPANLLEPHLGQIGQERAGSIK